MHSDKYVFIMLCATVWFINACTIGTSTLAGAWLGLGASLISIPVWALIGGFLSSLALFLFRLARVDVTRGLSLWQKADVGLAIAVVLKPALGIPF
jgi:hypothetical protein